jgi:hypothetical protein
MTRVKPILRAGGRNVPKTDLTKPELIRVLEIIEAAQACICMTGVRQLLSRARDLVEAERSICGIAKLSSSGPSDIITVLNENYPGAMLDHYISERLYLKDPIVRYHSKYSTTRLWSEIFREVNDDAAKQAIDYASNFGLRYGVSSGIFVSRPGGVAITSFAGPKNSFAARNRHIAGMLAIHINNALARCACNVP